MTNNLQEENDRLRAALMKVFGILHDEPKSKDPYATMELHGDVIAVDHGSQHAAYSLGAGDLRTRSADRKPPFILAEGAEDRFSEAVSHFFNTTVAVTLSRSRISEIETIVSRALNETADEPDEETGDLESQVLRRFLVEGARYNAAQLYQMTDAESLADLEEILADLVDRGLLIRFYYVCSPFEMNGGIADYDSLDAIPEEFEDEWCDPPQSFTRDEALIHIMYRCAPKE